MQSEIIRIAVIGPESSGKTTLSKRLAEYYKTVWVPEFSREYIGSIRRTYTLEDVIHCTIKQMESEEEKESDANKILFSDTELIVCKIWLLDVFGDYPKWIDEKIIERPFDLYLLTSPDIPFIDDPVRENPLRRQYFFDLYKKELETNNLNYAVINGKDDDRFKLAIKFVDEVLKSNKR